MAERYLDTEKCRYEFVGGEHNGKIWHYAALEARNLITGYAPDLSAKRATGALCKRAELDNQPLVEGYYPPMYDGERYLLNGLLKYEWQCTEAEKAQGEKIHMIRYETAEVYNMLSN